MRRPENLIYATEERPPALLLAALALQQILIISVYLTLPVLLGQSIGLSASAAGDLISLTMIGVGISALWQLGRVPGIGSALFVLATPNSIYLPGSLIAMKTGGLPSLSLLIVVATSVQFAAGAFLQRLRAVLPTELSGFIVLIAGLATARLGVESILAFQPGDTLHWFPGPAVAGLTLFVMAGISVWAKGQIRMLGAVIGLIVGYSASLATGMVDPTAEAALAAAPMLRLPGFLINLPHWDANLVLVGAATGVAITLNSIGALTAAQRLNDADWKRQDLRNLSRGLYADALGASMTALIGGSGVSASPATVGLAASSRVTSRAVGYVVATAYLLLSLTPKFTFFVLTVPRPVLGAGLVFLSCALLISGITIISSRLLDARKTYTLGIAFAVAVATPAIIAASASMPRWMAPVTASPVLSAVLIALLLNPILRLGVRQQVQLVLPPEGLPSQEVSDFIARAGAAWGARRDIVLQVQNAILQCLETLTDAGLATGERRLRLSFDELRLDARLNWQGQQFPLGARRPTAEELLMDDDATIHMASYLIGRLASRVTSGSNGDQVELLLQFDH